MRIAPPKPVMVCSTAKKTNKQNPQTPTNRIHWSELDAHDSEMILRSIILPKGREHLPESSKINHGGHREHRG